MGISRERETILKWRLNCLQIFTVECTIGLDTHLAGYDFKGAQINADKDIEPQDRASIWHQSVMGEVCQV